MLPLWRKTRFVIRKLTSRLLSSNLSMEVKHTIFAQKNVKNNLNLGPNSTHVLREKAVQGLRLAIGLTAGIRAVTGPGICCIVRRAGMWPTLSLRSRDLRQIALFWMPGSDS